MNRSPLIALPGTLLDERSLAAMLSDLEAQTLILGEAATLDEELDRLAAHTAVPAVWVGHSLGGIVALHLAQRHPGCVAGLVLIASNARAGRDTPEARRAAQWLLAQREGLAALVHAQLASAYGLHDADDAALVTSLAAQAEAVGMQRFENQLAYARERPGLLDPLRALACPMLALSGEFDTLCPPVQSDEMLTLAQAPGRATHHTLAGAGHLLPLQQPRWAADRLRGFLPSFEGTTR